MGEGWVNLHVILPASLGKKLEEYARANHYTKSDVIRFLLEWYLSEEEGGENEEGAKKC